jgi:hypothetical protein
VEIAELQTAEGTVVDGCPEQSQQLSKPAGTLAVDAVIFNKFAEPGRSALGAMRVFLKRNPAPEPSAAAADAHKLRPIGKALFECSRTALSGISALGAGKHRRILIDHKIGHWRFE